VKASVNRKRRKQISISWSYYADTCCEKEPSSVIERDMRSDMSVGDVFDINEACTNRTEQNRKNKQTKNKQKTKNKQTKKEKHFKKLWLLLRVINVSSIMFPTT
jgi:hypothetical protein